MKFFNGRLEIKSVIINEDEATMRTDHANFQYSVIIPEDVISLGLKAVKAWGRVKVYKAKYEVCKILFLTMKDVILGKEGALNYA